jgi:hypothetical protein
MNGAPGRARTCDIRIRSPTLYPAELRAHILQIQNSQFNIQHGRNLEF